MNYLHLTSLYEQSKVNLQAAVGHFAIASQLRSLAGKQLGDSGEPCRYPISGGVCAHWPDWASLAIRERVAEAQRYLDLSLAQHLACGRRRHTWLAAKAQAGL